MMDSPEITNTDASGQGYLFPLASPLPGRNPAADEQAERELLAQAQEFALNLIARKQGSTTEFVEALTAEFGAGVKILLVDLVKSLAQDAGLKRFDREYITSYLQPADIETVLRSEKPKRIASESTLDELFARSSSYLSTDKFVELIQFTSKLREYSPYNNMLVYLQRPDATHWATASHWRKKFNRKVKDDARPLIMLQPMGPVMLVYDVTDTEGPKLPALLSDLFAVEGSFKFDIFDSTLENCTRAGIVIKYRKLGAHHAGSAIRSPQDMGAGIKATIELNEAHDLAARYATLCHEIAHIYLEHLGADLEDNLWGARLGLTRSQRELEAEAVAYMVCYRAGLTTKSAEHLAGYMGEGKELAGISIDMVMKIAGLVERMGKETIRPKKAKKASSNK
jgi:hypothetical protein